MSQDSYHLSHDDLHHPVLVKKSQRAKRMTLRVSTTRRDVTLTVPRNISSLRAGAFIEQHIDWLNQQIDGFPTPVPFKNGALIPYEGELHQLVFSGPRQKHQSGQGVVTKTPFEDTKGRQCEQAERSLHVVGHLDHAPRRLTDWLKKQARKKITTRADIHTERLGLQYKRIGVRDQTSRWGSCSSNKTLSFSWRLVLAPVQILDYVVAHEVAHLREMNHSPRFWKLVASTLPEYNEARGWLRQNGQDLHRYGASE